MPQLEIRPSPGFEMERDRKLAHFDKNRVKVVHMERGPPQLSEGTVALAAKLDPPKNVHQQKHCSVPFSFMDRLHDETCSSCRPPEPSSKICVPLEWQHMPWDEVEMRKHQLLDHKCHYFVETPLADEVEMKKQGLVDSEGHHFSRQFNENEREKAAQLAAKAHQKLEDAAKGRKCVGDRKGAQPHIKICPDVEVCGIEGDEDEEDEPCESLPPSTTTLTARPSQPNSASSPEPTKSRPSGTEPEPSKPRKLRMVEPKQEGRVGSKKPGPIVVERVYQTEDGAFEMAFTIQLHIKPKANDTDDKNEAGDDS